MKMPSFFALQLGLNPSLEANRPQSSSFASALHEIAPLSHSSIEIASRLNRRSRYHLVNWSEESGSRVDEPIASGAAP